MPLRTKFFLQVSYYPHSTHPLSAKTQSTQTHSSTTYYSHFQSYPLSVLNSAPAPFYPPFYLTLSYHPSYLCPILAFLSPRKRPIRNPYRKRLLLVANLDIVVFDLLRKQILLDSLD